MPPCALYETAPSPRSVGGFTEHGTGQTCAITPSADASTFGMHSAGACGDTSLGPHGASTAALTVASGAGGCGAGSGAVAIATSGSGGGGGGGCGTAWLHAPAIRSHAARIAATLPPLMCGEVNGVTPLDLRVA
jgi:hypothetical protein